MWIVLLLILIWICGTSWAHRVLLAELHVEWIRFFPAVVITGDKSNKSHERRHYVCIVHQTIGTLRPSNHVLQKNFLFTLANTTYVYIELFGESNLFSSFLFSSFQEDERPISPFYIR